MTQPSFDFAPVPEEEPAPDAAVDADPTLTVTELNDRIGNALRAAFRGRVWVRGEIQGLGRPSAAGHVYFNLVDGSSGRHHADAVVRVALFARTREVVERLLRRSGNLSLTEGLEVRIEATVDYHGPTGQLSLRMTGIDPAHTLGRMALDRDQLVRKLAAEGLLERNAALVFPPVPLRIGLVASSGTAGYNDLLAHLAESGLGFKVVVADARVQGPSASRAVARAVRRVGIADIDVIVVIRGGGSRSDLAVFDAEPIARAIAEARVPVITGIGHELDTSVADAVAHLSCKTPTACAAELVDRVRAYQAEVEGTWAALVRHAGQRVDDADTALVRRARILAGHTRGALDLAEQRLVHAGRTVQQGGRSALASADRHLGRAATRAAVAGRSRLHHSERQLDTVRQELARRAPRVLAEATAALDLLEARRRAVDPAVLLARGWSLTTTADGQVVRTAASVRPGDLLRTTLHDGHVESRVAQVSPTAPHTDSPPEDAP